MNKILEETLAQEKADPAFEQRMLAGFRSRAPQRSGLVKLLRRSNALTRQLNSQQSPPFCSELVQIGRDESPVNL